MLMLRCAAVAMGGLGVVPTVPNVAEPLCEGGVMLGGGGVTPSVRNSRGSPFEVESVSDGSVSEEICGEAWPG